MRNIYNDSDIKNTHGINEKDAFGYIDMKEQTKKSFNFDDKKIQEYIMRKFEKIAQEQEVIKKATQNQLLKMSTHPKTIENILEEWFAKKYIISTKKEGFAYKFFVTSKELLKSKKKICIKQNNDDTYEIIIYKDDRAIYEGMGFTERQFVSELDTFDIFLSTGKLSENSKLQKKTAEYSNLVESN